MLFGKVPRDTLGNPSMEYASIGVQDGVPNLVPPRIDLCSIINKMMGDGSPGAHATMLMLALTRSACARAGEYQFLQYNTMWYCPTTNCLYFRWFQRKTCSISLNGCTFDLRHWQICCFDRFVGYWLMDPMSLIRFEDP